MPRTWRNAPRLFSDFNTLSFASVMATVVLVPLLILMLQPTPFHCGGPDLPRVSRYVSMPGAAREDVMMVAITRDGQTYFGSDRIIPESLPARIADRLKDHVVERKVYISADGRARWDAIEPVLDGVRSAGILRVAFLVDQRRTAIPEFRP